MAARYHYRIASPPTTPNDSWSSQDQTYGTDPIYIQLAGICETPTESEWHNWMYMGDECLRDLYETIGAYFARKACA